MSSICFFTCIFISVCYSCSHPSLSPRQVQSLFFSDTSREEIGATCSCTSIRESFCFCCSFQEWISRTCWAWGLHRTSNYGANLSRSQIPCWRSRGSAVGFTGDGTRSQPGSGTFNAITEKLQPFISQTHLLSFLQDFKTVSSYLETWVGRCKCSRLKVRQIVKAETTAFTGSTGDTGDKVWRKQTSFWAQQYSESNNLCRWKEESDICCLKQRPHGLKRREPS